MPPNLAFDDRMLKVAVKVGGHSTKKDAVNAALKEYVEHRMQLRALDLFGKIDFDPAYDYKRHRRR